jgi:hypothetical protein
MHTTRIVVVAVLAALAAGCVRSPRVETTSGGDIAPATPTTSRMLPAGTSLEVTMNQELSTKSSKVGDVFTARVATAVIAQNGAVAVPAGATVWGHVTGVKDASNVTETAALVLDFDSLTVNGVHHPFEARITATDLQEKRSTSTRDVVKAGAAGAVAGAALGAILSGADLDKILLGAGLGAVTGTAISLGTGDTHAVLAAGSRMTVQTTQSIALR